MAKMFKKLFAMTLVLCMLTGMLPVHALGEEVIVTPEMEATIETSEETPVVVVSIEPAAEAVAEETEEAAVETEAAPVEEAAEETEAAEEAAEEAVESGLTTEETFEENYGFAEEGIEVDEEKITIEETVTENTEITTDEEGNTVVTETVETETSGTIEEGAFEGVVEGTLEGEETYTETTVTTPEGEEIGHAWEQEGSETLEYVTEEAEGEAQPDVTVELIPGEKTEATSDPVTEVTGDVAEGVDDTEYDYTETTTTDRTVTAETSDVEITVNDADTGLVDSQPSDLKGVDIVYDEDDDLVISSKGTPDDNHGKDGLFDRNYLSSHTLDYIEINGVSIWVDKGTKKIVDIVTPEGAELPDHALLNGIEVGSDVKKWYSSSNSFVKKNFPADTIYKGGAKTNDIDNWYNEEDELVVTIPEGADFRYVGTGEHSKYFVGFINVVYAKDENGNTVYDEDGNPVIEALKDSAGNPITINGEPVTQILPAEEYDGYSGSRAQNFMLMDKNGNRVYGYCCDIGTGANAGTWYSFSNLEDCDYYASEESEEHIRSIVMNGYWGTSDVQKEDGTYETGSLEGIKAKLKEAIAKGEISATIQMPVRDTTTEGRGNVVLDEEGNVISVEVNVLDILDGLTEGEAMLATQAAIWSFSNGHQNALNGQDGSMVVSPDWYRNHQIGYSKNEKEHITDEGGARVDLLYNWLLNLKTEEESTIVINEKNFVEDVTLTVHEKVEDAERNNDEDQNNDVYNTDLNFKLAFIPGPNDDLLVQVTYTDFEGNVQNVVRRLAGSNAEGQTFEDIRPDTDGSYVIKGLKLSENEDFNFDLRLEGTQYLEEGVYVYQAVGGRDVSQTFVGIAEGTRNVDVSMGVTIKFDVDESNHVVATRRWHNEGDPRAEIEQQDPPTRYRYTGPGTVIEEEPVPLADVPQTGDNSILWFALILMSGCALCILKATEKKCKA